MGARFKGLTPFIIHFRVKAMLSTNLRRAYMACQSGMWTGVLLGLTGIFVLAGIRLSLRHDQEFLSQPGVIVGFVFLGIAAAIMVVCGFIFRFMLRWRIVEHCEKALARRYKAPPRAKQTARKNFPVESAARGEVNLAASFGSFEGHSSLTDGGRILVTHDPVVDNSPNF